MNLNNFIYTRNAINNSDKYINQNKKVEKDNGSQSIKASQLTEQQQATLDKLKEKYGNMDFHVVDSVDSDEAKRLLESGSKDYNVVMTQDELEKMASDDDYLAKRMGDLDDVMKMSDKLKAQFENDSEEGKEEGGSRLAGFGVTFNDDGTTSYFVELEKLSEKQKERIDASKEKKADEKRAQKKEADEKRLEELRNPKSETTGKVEKTQIKASSFDELMKKVGDYIQNEKMANIKTDEEKMVGQNFDFRL